MTVVYSNCSRIFSFICTVLVVVAFGVLLLAIPSGIFEKPDGCFLAPIAVAVTFTLCIIFSMAAMLFFGISLVLRMNDPFGIRMETLFDMLGFIATSAIGLVSNIFMTTLGFQFASLLYQVCISAYLFYSITLTGIVPVLRSFCTRNALNIMDSNLKDLNVWLENDTLRGIFKHYSKSELAVENVLFYEECLAIARSKHISQAHVQHIVSNFLHPNASLEINVNTQKKLAIVRTKYYYFTW